MAVNKTPDTESGMAVRLLASYGGMFLSAALALLAYLSFRQTLHVGLVTFDVYVFAWRIIDIVTAIVALVGILILSVVDFYHYRNAAINGRFLRALLRQCGLLAAVALLFLLLWYILL